MKKFIFTRTQKEHFGWVVRLPGYMRSYNWRSLSGWPGNWLHGFGLAGWGGWIWVEWNWRGNRDHEPCPSWSWTPSAVSPQSLFQIHIKQIFLARQFEGPSNWCQPRGPCLGVATSILRLLFLDWRAHLLWDTFPAQSIHEHPSFLAIPTKHTSDKLLTRVLFPSEMMTVSQAEAVPSPSSQSQDTAMLRDTQ